MSLVVVGSVAYDGIETPFGKVDRIVGGAATYISLAASFFYQPIVLISVIGDDFSEAFLQEFQRRGIDLTGLQIRKGEKSFFWRGRYGLDLNTRETLKTELNVLERFQPILPEQWRTAPFLMLGNLDPDIQLSVLRQFTKRPLFIGMDTMNFWLDTKYDRVLEVMKEVDVLIVNDEEARQLTKEYALAKAAKQILSLGPSYVIIKKGEHGALLFSQDAVFYAPALPLEEVFDPTGAGDTFAGGFMGYLAQNVTKPEDITLNHLKNAVIYGSALASFCVEAFGPNRLLEITPEAIHERYLQFYRLVAFEQHLPLRSDG
jgi:sugar/nucleoside kinase (ribokinase family)